MCSFSPRFSSIKIKAPTGEWVDAAQFNISDRVRLLEAKDTVLGELFIPLRRQLESSNITERELSAVLERGSQLVKAKNCILTYGIQLLFGSHSDKLLPLAKLEPARWPQIAPYLIRRESLRDRTLAIESILNSAVDEATQIDACRFLGTVIGAKHLVGLLQSSHADKASFALATLPNSEIPLEQQVIAAHSIHLFPILGATISKQCVVEALANKQAYAAVSPFGFLAETTIDASDAHALISAAGYLPQTDNVDCFMRRLTKINRSFLADGITYPDMLTSLNFTEDEVFEATVAALRLSAIEAIKARQSSPSEQLKEHNLQANLVALSTPAGARKYLYELYSREIPDLFVSQAIPIRSADLAAYCLHDRCRLALVSAQGEFEQGYLRYVGKWHWVARQLSTRAPNDVSAQLRSLSINGASVPAADLIGQRGTLAEDPEREINSIDVIRSITNDLVFEQHVFEREELALRAGLPSIGIEIQNFDIPVESFLAWKDYLKSHGIRSAWRAEFGSLVEASLPPFFDLDNLKIVLDSLERLGFFPNQDEPKLGLHVSIGLPLNEEFKHIAIGLLSLFPIDFDPKTSNSAWVASLRNVFSKGLIYDNPASRAVHPSLPCGNSHSELRVISTQSQIDLITFRSKLDRALRAAQSWGKELSAGVPSDKFDAFRAEVLAAQNKSGLSLLNAKWAYGSGDPEDIRTLQHVPMVQALKDYRHATFVSPQAVDEFHKLVGQAFLKQE